jgi:hypothetical protein
MTPMAPLPGMVSPTAPTPIVPMPAMLRSISPTAPTPIVPMPAMLRSPPPSVPAPAPIDSLAEILSPSTQPAPAQATPPQPPPAQPPPPAVLPPDTSPPAAPPPDAPASALPLDAPPAPGEVEEAPKKRVPRAIDLQTSGEDVLPLVSAWDQIMPDAAPPPAAPETAPEAAPQEAAQALPDGAPDERVHLAAAWEFVGYQGDEELPAPPPKSADEQADWGAAVTPQDEAVTAAMAAMRKAAQPEQVTAAFLSYCERTFPRAFWFILHYGVAMLWRGIGPGSDGAVLAFRPELKEPSIFKTAVETGKPAVATVPTTPTDEAFYWAISPPSPSYTIAVPLVMHGRAREMLCVAGDQGAPPADATATLERLAACAAQAHERLARKP